MVSNDILRSAVKLEQRLEPGTGFSFKTYCLCLVAAVLRNWRETKILNLLADASPPRIMTCGVKKSLSSWILFLSSTAFPFLRLSAFHSELPCRHVAPATIKGSLRRVVLNAGTHRKKPDWISWQWNHTVRDNTAGVQSKTDKNCNCGRLLLTFTKLNLVWL